MKQPRYILWLIPDRPVDTLVDNAFAGEPVAAKKQAHHVTLGFNITADQVPASLGNLIRREAPVPFTVTGQVVDYQRGIQSLRVELPASMAKVVENPHPHITMYCAQRDGKPAPAMLSNAVLADAAAGDTAIERDVFAEPIPLTGKVVLTPMEDIQKQIEKDRDMWLQQTQDAVEGVLNETNAALGLTPAPQPVRERSLFSYTKG